MTYLSAPAPNCSASIPALPGPLQALHHFVAGVKGPRERDGRVLLSTPHSPRLLLGVPGLLNTVDKAVVPSHPCEEGSLPLPQQQMRKQSSEKTPSPCVRDDVQAHRPQTGVAATRVLGLRVLRRRPGIQGWVRKLGLIAAPPRPPAKPKTKSPASGGSLLRPPSRMRCF